MWCFFCCNSRREEVHDRLRQTYLVLTPTEGLMHVFICFCCPLKPLFIYLFFFKKLQNLFAYLAPHHKQSSVLIPSFSPEYRATVCLFCLWPLWFFFLFSKDSISNSTRRNLKRVHSHHGQTLTVPSDSVFKLSLDRSKKAWSYHVHENIEEAIWQSHAHINTHSQCHFLCSPAELCPGFQTVVSCSHCPHFFLPTSVLIFYLFFI